MPSPAEQGLRRRAKLAKDKNALDKKNIKGMANAMRVQILTILNERPNSATRIAKELGVEFGSVSYEMEVLREIGLIEIEREVKRRGAMEVFYRATSRALLDNYEWPAIPDGVKGGLRASLLQTLMDDAIAAVQGEAYDSQEGAHMSWTPMIVDRQGWEELVSILLRTLNEVIEVHERNARRLTDEDATGIPCTVSILGYPSACGERAVGLPMSASDLVTPMDQANKVAGMSAKKNESSASTQARKSAAPATKRKRTGI